MSGFSLRWKWAKYLWLSLLALTPGELLADERILEFHADIKVQADASLLVSEQITVRAEGVNIRRGIFRDFPTRYRDQAGNRYQVSFQVLDVWRNGQPEDFSTEQLSNGIRVYMGKASRMLPQGDHEYRLTYRTTRQLGYFETYDELYWNVTGNGWMFPIDRASARIKLPATVPWQKFRIASYTGAEGETGSNAESHIADGTTVEFNTTAVLAPYQGLTISLGWPKGLVHEPGTLEKLRYFLSDNQAALVLLLGFSLTLAWYLWSWDYTGRDPRKGIIIPRYESPKGLSPAGCRYLLDMSLGNDAFTAAVISLGVKGYLKIDDQEEEFTLFRQPKPEADTASLGEAGVLEALLPETESWITLEQENNLEFRLARGALKDALDKEHKGRLFKLNTIYALPAIIVSILAALAAIPLEAGLLPWVAYGITIIAMHITFVSLLRAPTPAGRRIMDEIEGLRMYLDTAERGRLDRLKSPRLTPELFEMFLPYAFALGVENHWCERFAREFPEYHGTESDYHPAWYSGRLSGVAAMNHIGSGFGSEFSTAISSASTPPGSSSGSGGGGSSGGGGGGGGGGGW